MDKILDGGELVARAQETRAAARRFAEVVKRFGVEMPEHLDRFHQAMTDTRRTATRLRRGGKFSEAGGAEVVPFTRPRHQPALPAAAE